MPNCPAIKIWTAVWIDHTIISEVIHEIWSCVVVSIPFQIEFCVVSFRSDVFSFVLFFFSNFFVVNKFLCFLFLLLFLNVYLVTRLNVDLHMYTLAIFKQIKYIFFTTIYLAFGCFFGGNFVFSLVFCLFTHF